MELLVCELARKGKLLVGEPYFEGGVPVVVDRKGAGAASAGDLVVLRQGRGRARLEEVLGPASRIEAVLEGLLWHEGLRRPHPAAESLPLDVEPDRVDLRHLYAFTIDPDEAKDFDDALTFQREGGGGVRAWVHIADVSAYVPAGAPLDRDCIRAGELGVRARPRRPDAAARALGRPLQPAPAPGPPLRHGRDPVRRRPRARRAALLPQPHPQP